jgi:hypothetical protein
MNPEEIFERKHGAGCSRSKIAMEKWETLFVFRLFHRLLILSPLLCSAAAVLVGQRHFTHPKSWNSLFWLEDVLGSRFV